MGGRAEFSGKEAVGGTACVGCGFWEQKEISQLKEINMYRRTPIH